MGTTCMLILMVTESTDWRISRVYKLKKWGTLKFAEKEWMTWHMVYQPEQESRNKNRQQNLVFPVTVMLYIRLEKRCKIPSCTEKKRDNLFY